MWTSSLPVIVATGDLIILKKNIAFSKNVLFTHAPYPCPMTTSSNKIQSFQHTSMVEFLAIRISTNFDTIAILLSHHCSHISHFSLPQKPFYPLSPTLSQLSPGDT